MFIKLTRVKRWVEVVALDGDDVAHNPRETAYDFAINADIIKMVSPSPAGGTWVFLREQEGTVATFYGPEENRQVDDEDCFEVAESFATVLRRLGATAKK